MSASIDDMLTGAASRLEATVDVRTPTELPWQRSYEIAASNPDALRSTTGTLHTRKASGQSDQKKHAKAAHRMVWIGIAFATCLGLLAFTGVFSDHSPVSDSNDVVSNDVVSNTLPL
jgi:hypothetical protein